MKRFIALLTVLLSFSVHAETVLICQEWGYANSPEGFHDIKLEKLETTFSVSDERVVKLPVGTRFTKVDPETVGLADMQAETYKVGLELLYIYKFEGATKVGIRHLVEESDVFFGDKELYSDCSYSEVRAQGGSHDGTASKSLFVVEAGRVHRAPQVYRF